MNYTLTKNNLHIEDSYLVSKKAMMEYLIDLFDADAVANNYDLNRCSHVWLRNFHSLRAEWVVHNFLHRIGLWRERTKDVDLDYPSDKPEWFYKAVAALVWPFVE